MIGTSGIIEVGGGMHINNNPLKVMKGTGS